MSSAGKNHSRRLQSRPHADDSFRILVEAVDDHAIFMLDPKGNVISWNSGAENIEGWRAGEIIGQHFSKFYGVEDAAAGKPDSELQYARAHKRIQEEDWRYRKDGSRFWASVTITLLRDDRGRECGFAMLARDLSEQRRTELAIKDSEARLAGIIGSAMDAIITTDEQQRITLFNPAAEKMFGRRSSEVLGQPLDMLVPPRYRQSHSAHVRHFGETGVTRRKMSEMDSICGLRAKGEEFPIEASISQVTVAGQKLFTAILRDISERLLAAGARERLAAIVDSSDDAIICKTLDGTITAWNHGAESIFGYSPAEAVGKTMSIVIPPRLAQEEIDILARIARGESVKHFETTRVRKDGSPIAVSVTISPIRDAKGVIVGASKVARDITQQKLADVALRESEEKLRLAVEGAHLGSWHRNLLTDELERSPIACRLFGVPVGSKATFASFRDSVHPDDWPRVEDAIRIGLETRSQFDTEYRVIRPDNTECWLATRGRVFQNAAGENVRMGGIVFDVTDRHLVQEALRESEGRFHAMANSIPQLAWMAQPDGGIFWYNQRWYDYTGATFEQMEGWGWQSVHDPKTLPEVLERWKAAIATGQPFEMEFPLRGVDGSFRDFLTRGVPLKGADGRVTRWFGTNTDIDARKAQEREIRQLNDELEHRVLQRTSQLEEANRELESFTYSVAHDLRAPLRHIAGFSQILLEQPPSGLDPASSSYLKRIQDGAANMGRLLDELLSLAQVGRKVPNLHIARLNSIVGDVIAILEPEAKGRRVEWRIADLPVVECDCILVKQVFQNLISNALKYSRRRELAVIEIGQTSVRGETVLFVRDNGAGFNMKYADKLFGVFQRLHRSEEFEGTGVGLATVHRIVAKHGGRVWAEAELDKGATFYFTLGSPAVVAADKEQIPTGAIS